MDDLVDSKRGIERLFRWARASGVILDEWHEAIALKYSVPTDGVIIRRPIPIADAVTKRRA